MTGPEAYTESLRLARVAASHKNEPTTAHVQAGQLSQTYALLALAAATALTIGVDDSPTIREWAAVAGQVEITEAQA